MILGVYWYFDFPTDLYEFDYFEFKKGFGGHADNPAELIVAIETPNPNILIEQLKYLINSHPDGFLFIYQNYNKLLIGTGGHQLHDYDFLILKEVEKIIKITNSKKINEFDFKRSTPIKLFVDNISNKIIYPKLNLFQIVGSDLKKYNSETAALRLDCNIILENKISFISDIKESAKSENINVLYYLDNDFNGHSNIMLFFSNGRQGVNFKKKQYVDTIQLENKINNVVENHKAKVGHISGYDSYPRNGPKIELMVDTEFILNLNGS